LDRGRCYLLPAGEGLGAGLSIEYVTCPKCHGKGFLRGLGGEAEDCPWCEGQMTLPAAFLCESPEDAWIRDLKEVPK